MTPPSGLVLYVAGAFLTLVIGALLIRYNAVQVLDRNDLSNEAGLAFIAALIWPAAWVMLTCGLVMWAFVWVCTPTRTFESARPPRRPERCAYCGHRWESRDRAYPRCGAPRLEMVKRR